MKILFIDIFQMQRNGFINISSLCPPRLPFPQSLAAETIQTFAEQIGLWKIGLGLRTRSSVHNAIQDLMWWSSHQDPAPPHRTPSGLGTSEFSLDQSHPIPFETKQAYVITHVHPLGTHRHKQEPSYTPQCIHGQIGAHSPYTWAGRYAYMPHGVHSFIHSCHRHFLDNQYCFVVKSKGSAASSLRSNPRSAT